MSEDEIADFVCQINLCSGNGLKLLDNLLQRAESQTGQIIVTTESVDLHQLVSETIE